MIEHGNLPVVGDRVDLLGFDGSVLRDFTVTSRLFDFTSSPPGYTVYVTPATDIAKAMRAAEDENDDSEF